MGLITKQHVVTVSDKNLTAASKQLVRAAGSYGSVRIVTMTSAVDSATGLVHVSAVVETVDR